MDNVLPESKLQNVPKQSKLTPLKFVERNRGSR